MEHTLVLILLGWQVLVSIPQMGRLIRTGRTDGLSLAGDLLTAASGIGWICWALSVGDLPTLASGFLVLAGYLPTAYLASRLGCHTDRTDKLALTAGITGLLVAGMTGQLGLSLLWFAVIQYGPYLKAAMTADTIEGVSVAANVLRGTYGAGWAAYGLMANEWPLAGWGAVTMLVFLLVAATAMTRRHVTPAGVTATPMPAPSNA